MLDFFPSGAPLPDIGELAAVGRVGQGSIVVDIGCSEGYFAAWAEAQGAVVESFDARYGSAVGPYDGVCTVKGKNLQAYIIPGEGTVPMVSLETILSKYETVDYLKCDVEGGEYAIFDCDTDLSKVAAFAIEFHAWTTADNPQEGLAIKDIPMPDGVFDKLLARLEQTHVVQVTAPPLYGGYLLGVRKVTSVRPEGFEPSV